MQLTNLYLQTLFNPNVPSFFRHIDSIPLQASDKRTQWMKVGWEMADPSLALSPPPPRPSPPPLASEGKKKTGKEGWRGNGPPPPPLCPPPPAPSQLPQRQTDFLNVATSFYPVFRYRQHAMMGIGGGRGATPLELHFRPLRKDKALDILTEKKDAIIQKFKS